VNEIADDSRVRDPNPWLAREKAELIALLSLPDATTQRVGKMLALFGTPASAWEALRNGAYDGGDPTMGDWRGEALRVEPAKIVDRLASSGIDIVARGEPGYPARLAQIHDPPYALFCRGELPGDRVCVAIVGSRKATPYGLEVARWLARGLSDQGLSIVSGGAYGIDSEAHVGALEAGGHTCAVLGCGVDVVYPRSNAGLFKRVVEKGCLLSEYVPGTQPRPYQFPARNRVIAGLARAVVIVEASQKSGALITADFALSENREVLAVPGQVLSPNSSGTHALIRAGAALVTCPEDVLAEMGMITNPPPEAFSVENRGESLSRDERKLLEALDGGPCDIEDLARKAAFTVRLAMVTLSSLEVKGLVTRSAGASYQKCRPRA